MLRPSETRKPQKTVFVLCLELRKNEKVALFKISKTLRSQEKSFIIFKTLYFEIQDTEVKKRSYNVGCLAVKTWKMWFRNCCRHKALKWKISGFISKFKLLTGRKCGEKRHIWIKQKRGNHLCCLRLLEGTKTQN